jgi:hypothetical protein
MSGYTKYDRAEDSTSPAELAYFACDERVGVRWLVAHNKHTSPKTLAKLAQDKDGTVLYYVALNPNTPKDVRFLLLLEHPGWVE